MLSKEWFSAAELAALALPMMPTTKPNVLAMAERRQWQRPEWKDTRWRERDGKGGGFEYHYSVLPAPAQMKLAIDFSEVEQASEREAAKRELTREEMWRWFEGLAEHKQEEARARLEALDSVRALMKSGLKKTFVMMNVASHLKIKLSTLYNWEKCTHGIDRHDWLPYLAPRHTGRVSTIELPAEAWEMLKADYLRLERPTFEACFRRLERAAEKNGWTLPSKRTLERRMDDLPEGLRVLAREGTDALKRMYPAQRRDRGHFHALEAVNADGHKWDVFVKWPDGYVGRPLMVAFQDLYSGMILSWRIDRSENKEAVRLAFGDLVEAYGIPDHCWLDNGRSFASKWLTGGIANRYRFKIKDDEPVGIMTQLGVEVHWTTPYAGQSKPIERAFRDMAGDTAKHPRFAGAYTGNDPLAKPENYGSKAVPLDVFLATLAEEIAAHNKRPGRQAAVCKGRSFLDTFNTSYTEAPIKKATEEQRRLWLLAAEAITVSKVDGVISLLGNRYWAEFLHGYRGTRLTIRFDPQKLHGSIYAYRLDGAYLGAAPCIENTGFADVDAGRAHARARNAHGKAQKEMLAAARSMSIEELVKAQPEPEEPAPAPETKVVRLFRGATALQPIAIQGEEDEEDPNQERNMKALAKINAAGRGRPGGVRLRVIDEDTGD